MFPSEIEVEKQEVVKKTEKKKITMDMKRLTKELREAEIIRRVICKNPEMKSLFKYIPTAKEVAIKSAIRAHNRGRIHNKHLHSTLDQQFAFIGDAWKAYAVEARVMPPQEVVLKVRKARKELKLKKAELRAKKELAQKKYETTVDLSKLITKPKLHEAIVGDYSGQYSLGVTKAADGRNAILLTLYNVADDIVKSILSIFNAYASSITFYNVEIPIIVNVSETKVETL